MSWCVDTHPSQFRSAPQARQPVRGQSSVRREVKQAALDQIAQAGPAGVSISAIGKQLGVSGPALYRYFGSRDELLTELEMDAYHPAPASPPATALRAVLIWSRLHGIVSLEIFGNFASMGIDPGQLLEI